MPAMLQAPGTAALSTARANDTTQQYPLGTKLLFADGRKFTYAGAASGAATVAGKVYQSEAPGANFDDIVVPATAIGARALTVTTGATAITADDFNGGYVVVQDDTGEGYAYLVEDTAAVSATTLGAGALSLAEGIVVALTSSTTVLLLKHPNKLVIVHPSPNTASIVGAAQSVIGTSKFGFLQTNGIAAVLTEGTVVIGQRVRVSESVDGAVTPLDFDEATQADYGDLGQVAEVAVDTEHSAINLNIPGN